MQPRTHHRFARRMGMQELLVLRHAKAVPWSPAAEDFPRQLSDVGQVHAQHVAR